jgi:hypothetical protein
MDEVERLARQMMKMQQGDKPQPNNMLAHYLSLATVAHQALKALEKEDALARSNSPVSDRFSPASSDE